MLRSQASEPLPSQNSAAKVLHTRRAGRKKGPARERTARLRFHCLTQQHRHARPAVRAREAPPLLFHGAICFFVFSNKRSRMFCKQRRGRGSAPHTWANVGNSPSMATQQGARHQKGAPTLLPRGTGTVRCLRLAPVCSPYRALPQTTQTLNPPYSTPR